MRFLASCAVTLCLVLYGSSTESETPFGFEEHEVIGVSDVVESESAAFLVPAVMMLAWVLVRRRDRGLR